MRPIALAEALRRVDESMPRASVFYARILVALAAAKNFTLSTADLGEELGRGRDSQAVRDACAYLEKIGLVTREMVPADYVGGRRYLVRLVVGR